MTYMIVGVGDPIEGFILGTRKTAAEALAIARAARRELGEVRILDDDGSEVSESVLLAQVERERRKLTASGEANPGCGQADARRMAAPPRN